MGFSVGGWEMRRLFNLIAFTICNLIAAFSSHAFATTYDYGGQPVTETTNPTLFGPCGFGCPATGSISGSVTFNFDTSQYTGTLSLSTGDTAGFLTSGGSISYPNGTFWFNPPFDTYGYQEQMMGTFSLLDGAIIYWNVSGSGAQVGCGGGPGCAAGSVFFSTSPTQDSLSYVSDNLGFFVFTGSNSGGGAWTEVDAIAAPVPEPSTWVMLLIGFAGIGSAGYRHKKSFMAPMTRQIEFLEN
jgi:hypothetical protein